MFPYGVTNRKHHDFCLATGHKFPEFRVDMAGGFRCAMDLEVTSQE